MAVSEANIPTYYTIDSETTVDSGWTVKEFLAPDQGIIKRVKAGTIEDNSIFDLAITTTNVYSSKSIVLKYSNVDTSVLSLDSKENIYYKLQQTQESSNLNQGEVIGTTSSGKSIYLKYYEKLREFYRTYSDFTPQDHDESYSIIKELIYQQRKIASSSRNSGNFSAYEESREYSTLLERIADQHKTAINKTFIASENSSTTKTLLPIYIWTKVHSGTKKVWYQLDIENTNSATISSVEGTSSKYRTIPENPIVDLRSEILNSGEGVHEVSLGTLARIDLTSRLDNETKTFVLEETIYGDVVMLSLNGQLLAMGSDFTFDKDTNSVSLIEAPETTDVVILHYINQPIYNI